MPAHGVTIQEATGGLRTIDTPEGSAIGVMASATELNEGDLRVLRTGTDVTDADDGSGTITAIYNFIRLHTTAPVVLNVVDDANLADATGSAASYTYAFRFLQAEAETGVRPRLLAQAMVGGVESDLMAVAERLKAQVFLDGPNSDDPSAITDVASYDDRNSGYCDPAIIDQSDNVIGSSVAYCAIGADLNFWESISNKPVRGVKALSRSIGFTMGDPNSQAQLLNDAKINTIIRKDGYRLWGGLSLDSDPTFKFLSAGRTDAVIQESIQEAFLWAVDKGITSTFVDDVVESVQAFLRNLKTQGAIIDGDSWANPELNTQSTLQAGQLWVDYDFAPVPPAHEVIFTRRINNTYLAQIVG